MVLNTLIYIALVIIVIIVIVVLLRFLFGVLFIIPASIDHDVNMLTLHSIGNVVHPKGGLL